MNVPHTWLRTSRRTADQTSTGGQPGTLDIEISQVIRKRIEEANGWIKIVGVMARTLHRSVDRVGWMFQLRATAYDLVRLPKLLATP